MCFLSIVGIYFFIFHKIHCYFSSYGDINNCYTSLEIIAFSIPMISFSYLILLFYWMCFNLVWYCSLVRELLGEGVCAEVRVGQRSFYSFPNLYLLWGCHSEEHKTLNLFVTFSVSQLSHIQECFPASGSVIPSHSGLVFQITSPTFRHFILLLWEFLNFHSPWLLIP